MLKQIRSYVCVAVVVAMHSLNEVLSFYLPRVPMREYELGKSTIRGLVFNTTGERSIKAKTRHKKRRR